MSRARLVITAVVVEGRPVAEVAAAYGLHRAWIYKLLARYRAEGQAAFEPRSRRPKTSPSATAADVVELVLRLRKDLAGQGLDAGPHTICWHLQQHHQITLPPVTVWRILKRNGQVTPEPGKRPRSSYIRFEAELPNEMWQTDFTHYRLATGRDAEILNFLDDHSRLLLACIAYHRVTGKAVVDSFTKAAAAYGVPASVLSDNGMVYTTRFAGGRGGRNGFENQLHQLGVVKKNSSPNHPQTCGKVERFHQTLKQWLRAQPVQPATISQLQALLDQFREHYNTARPHRSLDRRTPAAAYASRPKAGPSGSSQGSHDRVRRDRVDDAGSVTLRHNGRLHHIGVGRANNRTPVILLIQDLDVRVPNAATGELIRELVLDPARDYQPRGLKPAPHKQQPEP